MNERQQDKWICCGGVVFTAAIAVAGYAFHNHEIALFGAAGFTAFSGPLFMVMNRELNGNGSGSTNPTQG